MRFPVLLIVALLASASLAGCFGAKDDGSDDVTPNEQQKDPEQPTPEPETPTMRALSGLGVSASVEWVAPGTPVTFTATPPADAVGEVTYQWFYGTAPAEAAAGSHDHGGSAPAEEDPHAGHDMGGDANTGGHQHAAGDNSFDTGELQPGDVAEQVFDTTGGFLYHCHPHPWMKGNVTVMDGADVGTYHVQILDGDGTDLSKYRYYPENLEIGPGSTVIWHNNGTMMHTATMEAYEPPLMPIPDASGAEIQFAFPEAGKQRVVVVATDTDDGTARAIANVLVDANMPSDVYEESFDGSFNMAGFGQDAETANVLGESQAFRFKLEYDGTFTGTFSATSGAPVPPEIRVKLVAPSGEVVSEGIGTTGDLPEAKVYAGIYTIEVEGVQGGMVDFSVPIQVMLDLVPPAGDGHGHAH